MKYILFLTTLLLISCNEKSEKIYMLIDKDDKLIVKENRYYHLFENEEQLLEYKRVKNYKPNDVLQLTDTIEFKDQPFCPGASFSTSKEKNIDLKAFNALHLVNRKSLFQRKETIFEIYFVEKKSNNNFSVKKGHVLICE
ncbi:hypothetical protein [Aquimarina mytili]|uniref:Lipoprotein n=1 Tax=Aquimarina mytili TaxID=874423 RepID=A0A936ZWW4_9FLAO|nr:hypothetical protein [Aquimarina mytili]MBL0685792.1 hypothetical protein [Aquimarina mytili]